MNVIYSGAGICVQEAGDRLRISGNGVMERADTDAMVEAIRVWASRLPTQTHLAQHAGLGRQTQRAE